MDFVYHLPPMNDNTTNINCDSLGTLHDFWFDGHEGWGNEKVGKRWFMGSEDIDRAIKKKFARLADSAASGELNGCVKESGRLATSLVIALDQLPRNLHRKKPEAFAQDEKALALAASVIDSGLYQTLFPCEKLFVQMPFCHSENILMQKKSLAMFKQLRDEDPAGKEGFMAMSYESAVTHHDIIERFGRFPHRNDVLERESTKEELNWLNEGGETFGQ